MAEGGEGVTGSDIAGAASGAVSAVPAFIGRGQNKRIATGFYGQPGYDKNAPYFGGSKNGLKNYTNALATKQGDVEGRGANLANYGKANLFETAGASDRANQLQIANAMKARALGQVPSIAQMQADREMGQAQAAQGAQQASARGAAGLALAGQVAAGNTANAQSSIAGQAQVNAGNERMQAEQGASSAYGNVRSGDVAQQGQAAQQAQFQAGQQQVNRDANDNRSMGYEQLGFDARNAELGARTANQGTLAGGYNAANVANQQTGNQNAGSKGILETIKDFSLSDERAKIPAVIPGLSGPRRPDEAMPMMGAGSGAAPTSYEVMTGNGGENVGASGQAMSDFATKFVNHPGADPMVSDERAKRPLLARGIRPGAPVGPNETFNREGPRVTFDPVQGWSRMSDSEDASYKGWLNGAPDDPRNRRDWHDGEPAGERPDAADARRAEQDAADADITRRVGELQAKQASDAKDPAVGLDRVARDRKLIKGGSRMPSDDNAQNDVDKGLAPGTTDFESTKDKGDPGAGNRPWWMALSAGAKQLNEAQFGNRPTMTSDENAKEFTPSHALRRMDPYSFEHSKKLAEERGDGPDAVRERLPWEEGPSEDLKAMRDGARASDEADYQARVAAVSRKPSKPGAAELASGSGAADEVADGNRAMAGAAYAYKPGLTPPEQKPGEPNFGPMAQNMEKNPITATAVKTDMGTGLKVIDKDKALKVTMSGVADLQEQQDETRKLIALLAKGTKATRLALGGKRQ